MPTERLLVRPCDLFSENFHREKYGFTGCNHLFTAIRCLLTKHCCIWIRLTVFFCTHFHRQQTTAVTSIKEFVFLFHLGFFSILRVWQFMSYRVRRQPLCVCVCLTVIVIMATTSFWWVTFTCRNLSHVVSEHLSCIFPYLSIHLHLLRSSLCISNQIKKWFACWRCMLVLI